VLSVDSDFQSRSNFVNANQQSLMTFDLIALGETMIALAAPPGESLRRAPRLLVDHAGAESNTCVGLARLGFRVAWVSRLGDDEAGDRILDALRAEGPGAIDTQWVRRDGERPTGLMIKAPRPSTRTVAPLGAGGRGVRYYRTGSAASAMTPEDLAGVPLADARAVLVTGVTALIGAGPQATALAFLSRAHGLRIVDPNLRAGLWGSDRRAELVRPLIDRCDLLLTGGAEMAELYGDGDPRTLADRVASRGVREIVVRESAAVAALAGGAWHTLDVTRDAAVDPIGAGDAFNAGYIAVRLRGGSIDEALRAGARCGAAVTTAMSDTSAFPRDMADG
jgi:2-dehydro-3-deoxygluconokinase